MTDSLGHRNRREPGETGSQTDGNTGRKKLAGSTSRNYPDGSGSRPHPPTRVEQALRKFGKTIQAIRKQHGLSQERLGHDCGITASKMKKIEAGKINPNLFTMIHFADRLGVRLDRLLRGIK